MIVEKSCTNQPYRKLNCQWE